MTNSDLVFCLRGTLNGPWTCTIRGPRKGNISTHFHGTGATTQEAIDNAWANMARETIKIATKKMRKQG